MYNNFSSTRYHEKETMAIVQNKTEDEIYATVGRRERKARAMAEELEYDPYESVQCNSDTYVHMGDQQPVDMEERVIFTEQVYETIGKYSNNQLLKSSDQSRPVKDTCDLYAKVRKLSSVSKCTNANLDFVSKFDISRVDSNITEEDQGTSVGLFERKEQCGDVVKNEDTSDPAVPGQNADSELSVDEEETGKESILKRNCGLHGWQAADI